MFFANWLRSFRRAVSSTPSRRPRHCRPTLELLEDRLTPSSFNVLNTNDSGAGSLRQAILDANLNPGADRIVFAIPGSGVHTIKPVTGLPLITDPATIDGYTQAGASPNTQRHGDNAVLTIELDGSLAGPLASGLDIATSNTTVQGLVINRFGSDASTAQLLILTSGSSNVIRGNFLGTDVTGTTAAVPFTSTARTRYGVFILGPNNFVGGTEPAARNVISGNGDGVIIQDASATGNLVQGNFIGTDASGTNAIGNGYSFSGGAGVTLLNASANTVGGTTAGARNILSGNIGDGVAVEFAASTDNRIQGNYIGTDVTGTDPLPNTFDGVVFFHSGGSNLVGGTRDGAANLISANGGDGVGLGASPGNTVQGNFIGTDLTGTHPLGNGLNGVIVSSSSTSSTIGGAEEEAGNLIAFNVQDGILLQSSGNTVRGNLVLRNGADGIGLQGASNNNLLDNVSNRNGRDGIFVDATSTGNTIEDNTMRHNGRFDAEDLSSGSGTAGRANTWKKNHCKTANLPGLCSEGHHGEGDQGDDD